MPELADLHINPDEVVVLNDFYGRVKTETNSGVVVESVEVTGGSTLEENLDGGEIMSRDELDDLFASNNTEEKISESLQDEDESVMVSADEIDNLFASAGEQELKESSAFDSSGNVAEEHPNDVDQATIDSLMDTAKEKADSYEQEIVHYEEELVVPEVGELHINSQDIEALHNYYDKSISRETVQEAQEVERVDLVEETVNLTVPTEAEESASEENEVLSRDDLDSLFDTSNDAEVVTTGEATSDDPVQSALARLKALRKK